MSREFWEAARAGVLLIGFCEECQRYEHPSTIMCSRCRADLAQRDVSGRGSVLAVTVNHHEWVDWMETPYAIAVVALDEAPNVRLTTNVIDCPPEDVAIGMSVQARFIERGGRVLPVFARRTTGGYVSSIAAVPEPQVRSRSRPVGRKFEDDVVISGIGHSALGRGLARSTRGLTVDACLAAVDDAGVRLADVDGLYGYPGLDGMPGMSSGGVRAVMQDLGIQPTWHSGGQELPGQTGPLIAAMMAVSAGLCRHVLCFSATSMSARPATASADRSSRHLTNDDELQWRLAFGAVSPANWIALSASHYLHRYRVDRASLGWIAVTARAHAALNPDAIYRTPMSIDDYVNARPISTPFGLLDCDVPMDGAYAVVISHRDSVPDLRHAPVHVEAVGTQITEQQSWDQGTLTHQPNVFGPAQHLWSRTDLRPADVKAAQLYDGFTFNGFTWLEALGFCGIGEAADFVDGGARIALGGELPVNTHGGQLSAGRSNGYGAVLEAIRQIRGSAGARQVAGADVVVTSSGGGIPASCMLLRSE